MIRKKAFRFTGQLAVEFVFSLGGFLLLVLFILEIGEKCVARERAASLAGFGTSMQSSNFLDEAAIESQIFDFEREINAAGRIKFKIQRGRSTEVPGSNFYQLMKTKVSYEIPPVTGLFPLSWLKGEEIMVEQRAPLEN